MEKIRVLGDGDRGSLKVKCYSIYVSQSNGRSDIFERGTFAEATAFALQKRLEDSEALIEVSVVLHEFI